MSINSVVAAVVRLEAARAALKLESLHAQERATPALQGTSGSRLTLARRVREAQDQADSWAYLAEHVDGA